MTNILRMISVQQAQQLILENSTILPEKEMPIHLALRMVLSRDVIAPINLPPFNQSAMDGYAIKFKDRKSKLKVVGEVAAGAVLNSSIGNEQAIRIFTGAAVPNDFDTVVMQEKVIIDNDIISINDDLLKLGANVRKIGDQTKINTVVLNKGFELNAASIGFLSSLGIVNVFVYNKPIISIVVTGNELVKPGEVLPDGQIYESNSNTLIAALQSISLSAFSIKHCIDNEKLIYDTILSQLKNTNVLLLTGGISVGDYDFVGSALNKIGVENIFYKIKQKPGKPLYFGKLGNTLIFALPGNPASVLICFYEYVYIALKKMQGNADLFLEKINLPSSNTFSKKAGLSNFLKAQINDGKVIILEGQESFILQSFAYANALVYLPEEKETVTLGEIIEVHKLPS